MLNKPPATAAHPLGAGFYVVLAILIWSSLGVIIRLSGVGVHELIFYSALVSVVFLGVFVMPRPRYRSLVPRDRGLFYILLLGPLLLANTLTFFYAYKHTTISNAILTHYIAPVMVAILAPVFLKEPTTKKVAISIVVATAGLWILLGLNPMQELSGWREPGSNAMGIVAGLLSGVANAALILTIRALSINYHPVVLTFFENLVIVVMLVPFIKRFPAEALWSFLVVGLVHSTLAPIIYYRGMRGTEASRAAILGYVEPIGAIMFGMLFLAEYPGAYALLGGALILLSGWMAIKSEGTGT